MVRVPRIAVLLGSAATQVALAHHGISNFDHDKEIELTGTITELKFVNPHSWLHVDVTDENGNVVAWRCELRSATMLRRSGWSPEMFVVGETVRITGSPDRREATDCYMGTIFFENGRSHDRYAQIEKAPAAAPGERPVRLANGDPNIGGDWAPEQNVLTDPRGVGGTFVPLSVAETLEPGEIPEGFAPSAGTRGTSTGRPPGPQSRGQYTSSPVRPTEVAALAVAGYDPVADNPRFNCQPTNILFDWIFDRNVNRVIQREDTIKMLYGFMDLERTIYMNLAEHPADIEPSRAGHSIGRWDGDVLIVDTIGFSPGYLSTLGAPIMHSDQMYVLERISVDTEAKALTRSYVVEDPLYFVGQSTGSDTVYIADVPYEPYNCDDQKFGVRAE